MPFIYISVYKREDIESAPAYLCNYLDNNLIHGTCIAKDGSLETVLPNTKFIYPISRQKVWDDILSYK